MVGIDLWQSFAAARLGGLHARNPKECRTAGHASLGFLGFQTGILFLEKYRHPDARFIHDNHGASQQGERENIAGRRQNSTRRGDDDDGPCAGAAHGGGGQEFQLHKEHHDHWQFKANTENQAETNYEGNIHPNPPAITDPKVARILVEKFQGIGDHKIVGKKDPH